MTQCPCKYVLTAFRLLCTNGVSFTSSGDVRPVAAYTAGALALHSRVHRCVIKCSSGGHTGKRRSRAPSCNFKLPSSPIKAEWSDAGVAGRHRLPPTRAPWPLWATPAAPAAAQARAWTQVPTPALVSLAPTPLASLAAGLPLAARPEREAHTCVHIVCAVLLGTGIV